MNRIIVNDPEQGAGRPLGIAAPLLPIAQGSNSNIDLSGELGLGQASSASDFFDLHRVDVELAGRLTFATHDPRTVEGICQRRAGTKSPALRGFSLEQRHFP